MCVQVLDISGNGMGDSGARLLANMSSSTTHLVMNTISLSIKVGQEVKLRINSTQITITHYT